MSNAQIIWNFLKKEGFNDYGIAGLMGNLYAESGLQANNLQNSYSQSLGLSDEEYTNKVDNGTYTNFVKDSAGYGLAQWTYYTRKQNLLNYAKSKNKSIGDLDMQLEFLVKELKESYATVYNALKTASSVLEASNPVLLKFERPANQSVSVQNLRASYGQKYYDQYATNKGDENVIMAENTYKKGQKTKLSNSFYSNEFDCHGSGCCAETTVNPKLVEYLQKIRDHFGKSITVTSGYRCATHNKNVSGATNSRHTKGDAADISVAGVAPAEVAKYAESIGIKGIGLYETKADGNFVHIDTRTTKSFWYGQAQEKRTTFGGTTSTTTITTNSSNLSFGSEGDKVKELQNNLIKLGYDLGKTGADGDFGTKTLTAVKAFQQKYNLTVDGIVGSITEKAIKEALKMIENNNIPEKENYEIGEMIKLLPNSKYADGKSIPNWIINSKVYIRSELKNDDTIAFSLSKTGVITGSTHISNIIKYSDEPVIDPNFQTYIVQVTADTLNVRAGAGANFKITAQVTKHKLYTIVAEKDGWGKLKNGNGWISLKYTRKIK